MGLSQRARRWASRAAGLVRRFRILRCEQLEPRQMLSGTPLHVGAVYLEDHNENDAVPDTIEISFEGGAPGTQLTQLTIDTDKRGDGLSDGDCLFDTAPGGLGAYQSQPLTVVSQAGIDSVTWEVADGGTLLVFHFTGFDAGEKFVFSIDVDEMGFLSPNSLAEGAEFEGTKLIANFSAPGQPALVGADIFEDNYDYKLLGTGLDLPANDTIPPGADHTAGAVASFTRLSGTVFEDFDADNVRDPGDPGIAGVTLTLQRLVSGDYVSTGRTAVTDAQGDYAFENLPVGTYRVVETQPAKYLSVGAQAGTVDGITRGTVASVDVLTSIVLVGGDDSIHNDFAEVRPAAVSGRVIVDRNDNCTYEDGDTLLAGVTIELLDGSGNVLRTTQTDTLGEYLFDNLMPGTYQVRETQPSEYYDSGDHVGTMGGVLANDLISRIVLVSGSKGEHYDFCEVPPARLCGYVYLDDNNDGVKDPGEAGIAGVTLRLLDASGAPTGRTATTNDAGLYCFNDLPPGTYTVIEVQPTAYLDGLDTPGSLGGTAHNPGDRLSDIVLPGGSHSKFNNFGELRPATLSGYVFQDGSVIEYKKGQTPPDPTALRDGLLTPDDLRLAGVVLQLGDASGAPLLDGSGNPILAVTDANGYYQFTNLKPGTYTVLEFHPDGYVDSLDTPGTTGGLAVNKNAPLDPLVLSTLAVDPKDDALLRIKLVAGGNSQQNNFSEVLLRELPPDNPPDNPPNFPPNDPPWYQFGPPPLGGSPQFTAPPYPTILVTPAPPLLGGGDLGGGSSPFAWHLSVVNAGEPRRADGRFEIVTTTSDATFNPKPWTGVNMGQGQWIVASLNGKILKRVAFGPRGGIPVPGDFNGDGLADVAVFLDGHWFIDLNGDGVWDDGDLWAKLGDANDLPVSGDWDGDGKADIGIFGPQWLGDLRALVAEPGLPDAQNAVLGRTKNVPPDPSEATDGQRLLKRTAQGKLRADLIDHVFQFGVGGDRPVAGDFNGDGVKTVGVFRHGKWYLDVDGDGRWSPADVYAEFGQEDDLPVVGDWTGDGKAKLGVFRHGQFILDTNNNHVIDPADKTVEVGVEGRPAAADFDGDGVDEVAVYQDRAA